jgi:CBS domain-containing protein
MRLSQEAGGFSMQAKEIMTPMVECISPEAGIEDVARKMKSLDVGFLPVCHDDRLVGTLTDRDIVVRGIAEGKDLKSVKVSELLTHDVFWCYEDQTADEVAEYMSEKKIRRVLVLNGEKRLVGVISIGDLAKSGEAEKVGETTKEIAEAPPQAA